MTLRAAMLIHLLLLFDKAHSKKGELPFFVLIEQCLNFMGVLYLAGTVYTENARLQLFNISL